MLCICIYYSMQTHPLSISKAEEKRKVEQSTGRRERIEQLQIQLRQQEEQERKVKDALNRKALMYERMSAGDRVTYGMCVSCALILINCCILDDGREIEFMVDFGKKSNDNDVDEPSTSSVDRHKSSNETIEFTDIFGRQRRCAPNELADMISRRDASLMKHADRVIAKHDDDDDDDARRTMSRDAHASLLKERDDDEVSTLKIGPVHHANVASDGKRLLLC